MSKARDIADLLDSAGKVTADDLDVGAIGGRRNLIINGGFDVWQRGTTGTAVNGFSMNSADRWYTVRTAVSQELDSYNNPYAHCVCGDFADTNYIQHKVEFPRKLVGKTLTLSFWIKSDDGLGSNGSTMVRYYDTNSTYQVPLNTSFTYGSSWTQVTKTFTMPTVATNNDNYGLEIFLTGDSTNTNNNNKSFDIKEVQLELGSVATPFEHRSYGEELALCKRYYEIGYRNAGVAGNNSGYFRGRASYDVEKRASPSFSGLEVTINNQVDNRTTSNSVSNISKETFIFQHYPSVNAYSSGSNGWYKYIADAEL